LLHELQERYAAGEKNMRPTEANYKTVIDAFARIRKPEQAEQVWIEMLQNSLDNPAAKPGSESCKAVLASWLMSDVPEAVDRVIDLMDRIAEIDHTGSIDLKLNQDAYYLLFDICVKSKAPHIATGAERILRKMKDISEQGHGAMGPDTRCYNIAINCLRKVDNAERAEALFWEMYNEYVGRGKEAMKPDSISLSTVLMAWSRSSNENATRRAEVFFERVQKLISTGNLQHLEIDLVCYVALLQCLANSRTIEATEKAEAVLASLQERYRAGEKSLRPNEQCFLALVKCRVRVGNLEGAENLVFAMQELYGDGEKHLEPTRQICKIVFTSWLSSNEDQAPARAENFLRWMSQNLKGKDHPEDYASLLRCWARSRRPDSGVRAEKLLQIMFEKFGKSRIVRGCLSDVVCAFARSNDLERAEALLFRLCDDYANKRSNTQPDTRAFVAVLAAISRNKPPGVGTRSVRIVHSLREILSNNPTNPNKVLECWNQCPNDKEHFLAQMEQFDSADSVVEEVEEGHVENYSLAFKY
jgi:pentatricopeptide repeat protein